MYKINEDLSIYVTRGDTLLFDLKANNEDGTPHTFMPGDLVRMKVYKKKKADEVVLQKDFHITEATQKVQIYLTKEETKIGEVISKPVTYWYSVALINSDNEEQTIIGYDEETGAKTFVLLPEGGDKVEDDTEEEVIPPENVDNEIDITSLLPVTNQAVARAIARLEAGIDALAKDYVTPQFFGAVGDGEADDTAAIQDAITYAETAPEHTVHFPTGVYKVSGKGSIFNSKFVSLIGDNATILVAEGDGETDLFTFTGTSENYNGKITGLEFNYVNNNYTMIRNVFNFVFEKDSDILYNLNITNCLFRKNKGYKIYTNGWTNGGFNNCKFNDNIVYGLFIKSLSFGDSNKIIGNSLYGSEEIQLDDYVINLIQTDGSSGCEVSSNNCTSGLGYFENFRNLYMNANQIENTEQTNLDYLVKLNLGSCVTIDNCNLNAHRKSSILYSNIANCVVKNCNFYGIKDNGGYAINTDKAHILFAENVRYYDDVTVYYYLKGDVVNGHVTNTLYDDDKATFIIDSGLIMRYKPKITNTVNIAPLKCAVNTDGEVYIPVQKIGDAYVDLRITDKYQLYTSTLFDVPALIPVEYY